MSRKKNKTFNKERSRIKDKNGQKQDMNKEMRGKKHRKRLKGFSLEETCAGGLSNFNTHSLTFSFPLFLKLLVSVGRQERGVGRKGNPAGS